MIGQGSAERLLGDNDVASLCAAFIEQERLAGKRVLAVIPDHTRTGPMGLMFRTLYRLLSGDPGRIDFLIALGTHPPMSEAAIDRRFELAPGERARDSSRTRTLNHDLPSALAFR
jgi:nickel-dependent lactate racemase